MPIPAFPTLALRAAGALAFSAFVAGCAAQPPAAPATPATPNPDPQGAIGTPQGCKADAQGDDSLIGRPEAEAIALLQGCTWRLGERDGQRFPATMDYRPERRTLGIQNGKVTWVKRG